MNRTIYIKDEDSPIWDRARELAGEKLSPVIIAFLKQYILEKEALAKGFEKIRVSFRDADQNYVPKIKAFNGRWIFPPEKPFESNSMQDFHDDDLRRCFAVALTAKGSVVVYAWLIDTSEDADAPDGKCSERFLVYPSLEKAAADLHVNSAIVSAIDKIGVPVEELDI